MFKGNKIYCVNIQKQNENKNPNSNRKISVSEIYIQVKILVFQKEYATIYVESKNFFSFVRQWNEHSGLCV